MIVMMSLLTMVAGAAGDTEDTPLRPEAAAVGVGAELGTSSAFAAVRTRSGRGVGLDVGFGGAFIASTTTAERSGTAYLEQPLSGVRIEGGMRLRLPVARRDRVDVLWTLGAKASLERLSGISEGSDLVDAQEYLQRKAGGRATTGLAADVWVVPGLAVTGSFGADVVEVSSTRTGSRPSEGVWTPDEWFDLSTSSSVQLGLRPVASIGAYVYF